TRLQSEWPRRGREFSESTSAEFLFRSRSPCTARRIVGEPDRSTAPNPYVPSSWQPQYGNSRRAVDALHPAWAKRSRIQRNRFSQLFAALASDWSGGWRSVFVRAQTMMRPVQSRDNPWPDA